MATLGLKKHNPQQSKSFNTLFILGLILGVIVCYHAVTLFLAKFREIESLKDKLENEIQDLSNQKIRMKELELTNEKYLERIKDLEEILFGLIEDGKSSPPEKPLHPQIGVSLEKINLIWNELRERYRESMRQYRKEKGKALGDKLRKINDIQVFNTKNFEEPIKLNQGGQKQLENLITSFVKIGDFKALESYYDDILKTLSQELRGQKSILEDLKSSQMKQEKQGEVTLGKLEGLQDYTFKNIKELQKAINLEKEAQNYRNDGVNDNRENDFELGKVLDKVLNAYETLQEGRLDMKTLRKLGGLLNSFNLFSTENKLDERNRNGDSGEL